MQTKISIHRILLLSIGSLLAAASLLAQSKQETINWIASKFLKDPYVTGEFFKSSQKLQIHSDGSFVAVNTSYEAPLDPFNPEIHTIMTLTSNFKNFNPATVAIRYEKNLVFVVLYCTGKCISVTKTCRDGCDHLKNVINIGAFDNGEENIGPRLKKAFVRLITLCGGKNEVY